MQPEEAEGEKAFSSKAIGNRSEVCAYVQAYHGSAEIAVVGVSSRVLAARTIVQAAAPGPSEGEVHRTERREVVARESVGEVVLRPHVRRRREYLLERVRFIVGEDRTLSS